MTSEFIFHAFTTYVGIGERAWAKVERHETSRENVTKKWDPDSQLNVYPIMRKVNSM